MISKSHPPLLISKVRPICDWIGSSQDTLYVKLRWTKRFGSLLKMEVFSKASTKVWLFIPPFKFKRRIYFEPPGVALIATAYNTIGVAVTASLAEPETNPPSSRPLQAPANGNK